jgi:pimeloyl-ACP methyl ester carboxylesterase
MLLVGGLYDPVVPVDNVRVMAEALPDAWLGIFPGKHAAYYEFENNFIELYENFYDVYGVQ